MIKNKFRDLKKGEVQGEWYELQRKERKLIDWTLEHMAEIVTKTKDMVEEKRQFSERLSELVK